MDTTVELYLHGKGRPEVVMAEIGESLKALLARHDALPAENEFVFIGESEHGKVNPEAEEDCHEAIDIELSIEILGLKKLRHIHTRAGRRIKVSVLFNGVSHERRFSPAATVATATFWAKKRFNIDPIAGADLVLALQPDGNIPPPNEHLGELVERGVHVLAFNLVKEISPLG